MKNITSPVALFPGTVTLRSPMMFPEAIAWEKMLASLDDLREPILNEAGDLVTDDRGRALLRRRKGVTHAEFLAACIPGITAVVETWSLENFTVFQASPVDAVDELIGWLLEEIGRVYTEVGIPNG